MQIDRQKSVGAGRCDQVGDQFGSDRHPPGILAILSGVAEIGHHGRYPGGAGAPEAIQKDQQLHQIRIHGGACRLHDKTILAANVGL